MKLAFGGLAPHRDADAAVKFALNAVLMDDRLQELAELIIDGSSLGGIEGEPGWILERRDDLDEANGVAYPEWPAEARFKANVDEDAYRLQHPEFFMSRAVFMKYLMRAIEAYVAADSSRAAASAVIAIRKAI